MLLQVLRGSIASFPDEKPNLEMIAATLTAGLLAAHEMKPLAYDDAASVAVSYYRAVRKALLGDPFLRLQADVQRRGDVLMLEPIYRPRPS